MSETTPCPCGCGTPVPIDSARGQKYATPACRTREYRERRDARRVTSQSRPTQADRVLRALRQAGSRGIHSTEIRNDFIANPSQRILELEARGHLISHARERLHGGAVGTRYRLMTDAEAPARPNLPEAAPDPEPPAAQLFELPAPSFDQIVPVRNAINDDLDDVA